MPLVIKEALLQISTEKQSSTMLPPCDWMTGIHALYLYVKMLKMIDCKDLGLFCTLTKL